MKYKIYRLNSYTNIYTVNYKVYGILEGTLSFVFLTNLERSIYHDSKRRRNRTRN